MVGKISLKSCGKMREEQVNVGFDGITWEAHLGKITNSLDHCGESVHEVDPNYTRQNLVMRLALVTAKLSEGGWNELLGQRIHGRIKTRKKANLILSAGQRS
jgi:hypothetical protein